MRDRQYISSLAMTGAAIIVALVGLVAGPVLMGWWVAVGLLVMAALFLAWFYWGPRPDLMVKDGAGRGGGPDDD